ncbi:hypothetical protein GJ744_009590 [Endocarpon pusillum]|uniref:Uncharacterized protein n=1 Tax=Endocarpon pusillum TaxID=364733 RepID=A0A8H7E2J3_9EURO|nr:hypothetical protein GJ744_009590 [Endocarpon pusillum]
MQHKPSFINALTHPSIPSIEHVDMVAQREPSPNWWIVVQADRPSGAQATYPWPTANGYRGQQKI